jgi:anti-anti-sigma regulatory factor
MARKSGSEILIKCEGVFDVPAARRLEKAISDASPGDAVRVDLTHVREFHDFGIAVLSQALKHGGAVRIALQGLRHHQARMLRYFGVDVARFVFGAAENT